MRKIMKNNAKKWKHLPLRIAGRRLLMRFLIYLKEEIRKRLTAGKFPAYLSFTLMKESVNPQKLWVLTIQNLVRDTRVQKQLLKSKEMVRTYAFLPFLSFPSPIRSRASYGGNPVFGRFLTPWIPVPRLREDKLHGNDTDCVSPIYLRGEKDFYSGRASGQRKPDGEICCLLCERRERSRTRGSLDEPR